MSIEQSVSTLDAEETPQSRHRKKVAKEEAERKEAAKAVKEWHEISGGKVLKVTQMANGNKYRVFVCSTTKKNQTHIDILKKQGKLRA